MPLTQMAEVSNPLTAPPNFVVGQLYRRRDLHLKWGGQRQGGISTPGRRNLILLFTGSSGKQHGYEDRWTDDGIFFYTGEGQRGDMKFVAGNRAIHDHAQMGKDLHVFEQARKGFVRYFGQMVCTGSHYKDGLDTQGKKRKAIVFELMPLEEFISDENQDLDTDDLLHDSLSDLRTKALADSAAERTPAERKTLCRKRSKAVQLYVLRRANGECEGCHAPAPFKTERKQPYLEPHHIRRLSDGGPDHPKWVIAVCPNCHRHAHYAEDAQEFNARLSNIVAKLEQGN